jgi:biotin transporter BioY
MALTLGEELLIAFGSAVGGFILLWLFVSYVFSSMAQQMAETTTTAVQSIQNMYTLYVNTMIAMHGAETLTNHADNHLVNQQKHALAQTSASSTK